MKNKYVLSFLLGIILAGAFIIPNIIMHEGMFVIGGDFQVQQVPFNVGINNSIKDGNDKYTITNSLGNSLVNAYNFYSITSVFNVVTYFFPSNFFPYLIGPLLILKFGFTSLFAFIFLRTLLKKESLAVIGSLLYAFSGFMMFMIMFYRYIDAIMLLPLLLFSTDRLFMKKKYALFTITMVFNFLANILFGMQNFLFLIIYIVINFLFKRYKFNLKTFGLFIFNLLIALVIIYPFLYENITSQSGNPRISSSLSLETFFKYPFYRYVLTLKALLLPSDILTKVSLTNGVSWSGCELWLPMIGIFLAIVYVIKKKDWLSVTTIILLVMIFVPGLNSIFSGFSPRYYARWFYIITLFLSIISMKTLEEKTDLKKGIYIFSGIFIIYTMLSFIYLDSQNYWKNIDFDYILKNLIAIIGIILTFITVKKYYRTNNLKAFLLLITLFIVLTGNIYIYSNAKIYKDFDKYKMLTQSINTNLIDDDTLYRVKYYECPTNSNQFHNLSTPDYFSSTLSSSIYSFFNMLDMKLTQSYSFNDENLNSFLGVKYIISCDGQSTRYERFFDYLYEKDGFSIYVNNTAKDIGFILNKTMDYSSFAKIPSKEKIAILNEYMITDLDIKLNDVESNIVTNKKENGFISDVYVSDDTYVLYTIPYDENFEIYNNQVKITPIKVDNGLMAIKVNKGDNHIEITYKNNANYILILCGIIIFMGELVVNKFINLKKFDKLNSKRISKSHKLKA